jgi:hypothetical protein
MDKVRKVNRIKMNLDKIKMDKKMIRKLIQLVRKIQLVSKIQLNNKIKINLLMIHKKVKLKEKIILLFKKM